MATVQLKAVASHLVILMVVIIMVLAVVPQLGAAPDQEGKVNVLIVKGTSNYDEEVKKESNCGVASAKGLGSTARVECHYDRDRKAYAKAVVEKGAGRGARAHASAKSYLGARYAQATAVAIVKKGAGENSLANATATTFKHEKGSDSVVVAKEGRDEVQVNANGYSEASARATVLPQTRRLRSNV